MVKKTFKILPNLVTLILTNDLIQLTLTNFQLFLSGLKWQKRFFLASVPGSVRRVIAASELHPGCAICRLPDFSQLEQKIQFGSFAPMENLRRGKPGADPINTI